MRFLSILLLLIITACATNNPKTAKDYKNNQAYCAAQNANMLLGMAAIASGGGTVNLPSAKCFDPKFTSPKSKNKK